MNRSFRYVSVVLWILLAAFTGYFYGHRGGAKVTAASSSSQAGDYTCPMHPFIVSDKPGGCAICGMELVKKSSGAVMSDKELINVRHVALSPTQQVMANLATTPAAVKPVNREITCTGIVAYNQERQGRISAWLAGRVDRMLVKSVGSEVHKDRPVAEIYSVDLYNAQVQYLLAYKTIRVLNNSISVSFPINTHMAMGDASERLRQLGFREEQFQELQKADKPNVHVPIYSPFSGLVTEKFVKEGQYVNIGEPLFAIADLSRIWIELEVFESDLAQVKVGQNVSILSSSYPGETFRGKVKLVYPFLDEKTRTAKIRVELPNPGLKLKPEMYVQASISVPQATSLVVPTSAVMDTGMKQVVWIESAPGVFLPREVKTGIRSGKEMQILSGLKAGEKVANTGAYLIDSEAQLSRGADAQAQPAAPAAAPTRPPAPKPGLDMKDMKM
jgi:Cu(I)/Ag(I) efflux system membrane fusion protein